MAGHGILVGGLWRAGSGLGLARPRLRGLALVLRFGPGFRLAGTGCLALAGLRFLLGLLRAVALGLLEAVIHLERHRTPLARWASPRRGRDAPRMNSDEEHGMPQYEGFGAPCLPPLAG